MPSQIRVDSISNLGGDGAVELTYGASIPSTGKITVQGNLNIAGVSTVGFLTLTNANISGIVTAASFVGDGSGLIGIPVANEAKTIAFAIIGS